MSNVLLLAAIALGQTASASSAASAAEPRKFHEIEREISLAFKQEATAKAPADRGQAVRTMTDLYDEILADPRLATSDTLKEYRTRLYTRLRRVQTDLKQKLAREQRQSKEREPSPEEQAAFATLAASLSLADSAIGGPAQVFAHGGGIVPPDGGRELVELIERTINPSFWNSSGGPGAIYYFQPLQCLVISATAEVHENIGGLLGGVRK
jgi:hypothetical protein